MGTRRVNKRDAEEEKIRAGPVVLQSRSDWLMEIFDLQPWGAD
jgi:hypothetical protein